jgi:ankyrin repeat protein
MNERTKEILARVHDLPDFEGVDSSDINGCGTDGDNALHVVVRWGDVSDAKELIDAGIDVNKAGDLGYTPLHIACMGGNREMVGLLLESGADLFALNEGYPPFTAARLAGKDDICDLLAPLMNEAQLRDPKIRLRSRISQLRRELAELEAELHC